MEICKENLNLLKEIMSIDFCLLEMNLFLDTHPQDSDAIMLYNKFLEDVRPLKIKYEREVGPLTVNFIADCPWSWIDNPWPWEIDYMEGV